MSNKPPAGTTTGSATEWYLAAVLDELQKLNNSLNPPPVSVPDDNVSIEIKEPAPKPEPEPKPAKRSTAPKTRSRTTKPKATKAKT